MEYTKENIIKLIEAMQDKRFQYYHEAAESDPRGAEKFLYAASNTLGAVLLILRDEEYFKDYCTLYRDELIKD